MSDKSENSFGTPEPASGLSHDAAMEHAPQPSLWPLLTAVAVSIAVIGLMVGQAVVVVGGVLVLVFIVAWGVTGGHE
jgi:hypothetical protein